MNKLLIGMLLAVASFSCAAQQGAVVRGESSAGVYENIKSTSQALNVTAVGSGTPVIGVTYTPTSVSVLVSTTVVTTANATRRYLSVQNQDATNPIWIRCDGTSATADGTGIKIAAGQTWAPSVPPVGACNGISTGGTVVANVIQG